MRKVKMDERPARSDLTDRECAKIIRGLLGSLSLMVCDQDTLRRAVQWWAETDDCWRSFEIQAKVRKQYIESLMKTNPRS